ncbi:hypothetical protein [Virgibacillus sp. DJP39]
MKKNKELPTFTILNPEFHSTEDILMNTQDMDESGEEATPTHENHQD